MAVSISGYRIGDLEVRLQGTEGQSLRQVFEQTGVRMEGTAVVLNGVRLSEREAGAAVVHDGDRIEVNRKVEAGA